MAVASDMTVGSDTYLEEVGRICLHKHKDGGDVAGMVVYHQRVYVVHDEGLIVYCYARDGSLSHKYEHKDGAGISVNGMSLIIDGETAMLVVSDELNKDLVWITISDDVNMEYHHTQHLDYRPCGSCNDRGNLMVCDPDNHNIHRYSHDGETLAVIKLPNNVWPWWVARHGDGDQYVVTEYCLFTDRMWDDEQVSGASRGVRGILIARFKN